MKRLFSLLCALLLLTGCGRQNALPQDYTPALSASLLPIPGKRL